MNICIYGASSAELKKIYYEKTEELGRLIGKTWPWPCFWRWKRRTDGCGGPWR